MKTLSQIIKETYLEEKRGLWDNIHAKQERIKNGSKERMRKPGSEGAPTKQDFINSQSVKESSLDENAFNQLGQKKPVGDILPAPAKGSVPKHGKKFKEGDIVVPHAGPHAGVKHKVVVARAGSVNMIPLGLSAREDKYNSATVRANHEHLSPYKESVKESAEDDEREYDFEGEMAKSQLYAMIEDAKYVISMMEDDTNLPEWLQTKITLAADYISTVSDYLTGENAEDEEDDE
jgi:hypothetical protein